MSTMTFSSFLPDAFAPFQKSAMISPALRDLAPRDEVDHRPDARAERFLPGKCLPAAHDGKVAGTAVQPWSLRCGKSRRCRRTGLSAGGPASRSSTTSTDQREDGTCRDTDSISPPE
ncbi:hypothetical protein [Amycolatopsis australiensis]|uniref:hypothetical protein n=1 Tax=Amycolatopsis australiensis TaxID=546364 RepID=UPI001161338F|nr:hypothetical protein [Amycolatopsis australiensis]